MFSLNICRILKGDSIKCIKRLLSVYPSFVKKIIIMNIYFCFLDWLISSLFFVLIPQFCFVTNALVEAVSLSCIFHLLVCVLTLPYILSWFSPFLRYPKERLLSSRCFCFISWRYKPGWCKTGLRSWYGEGDVGLCMA